MKFSKYVALAMAAALAAQTAIGASAGPMLAQQNPESTPAPAAANAAPNETEDTNALIAKANAAAAANAQEQAAPPARVPKAEPSASANRKAREYGFHAEMYDGKTWFCRDDAMLGTRIASKWCLSSDDFEDYSTMLKIARDLMRDKGACQGGKAQTLGGVCGGLQ